MGLADARCEAEAAAAVGAVSAACKMAEMFCVCSGEGGLCEAGCIAVTLEESIVDAAAAVVSDVSVLLDGAEDTC